MYLEKFCKSNNGAYYFDKNKERCVFDNPIELDIEIDMDTKEVSIHDDKWVHLKFKNVELNVFGRRIEHERYFPPILNVNNHKIKYNPLVREIILEKSNSVVRINMD